MLLKMSLSLAGIPSLRAMASLRVTALPITLRLEPQVRQNFKSAGDSVPHWGQNIGATFVTLYAHMEKVVALKLTSVIRFLAKAPTKIRRCKDQGFCDDALQFKQSHGRAST